MVRFFQTTPPPRPYHLRFCGFDSSGADVVLRRFRTLWSHGRSHRLKAKMFGWETPDPKERDNGATGRSLFCVLAKGREPRPHGGWCCLGRLKRRDSRESTGAKGNHVAPCTKKVSQDHRWPISGGGKRGWFQASNFRAVHCRQILSRCERTRGSPL